MVVYVRDQQAAGAIYRLYRRVRVLGQVSGSAPLSVDRAVGRRALLSYAAEDAGAPTPRLRALIWAGPEASVLAYEHHEGRPLAQRDTGCSDAELSQIWEAVGRLHAHKVTHRGLTADRILLTATARLCCSTRAMATWQPATCRSAWTWPSSSLSSPLPSARTASPVWRWSR